MTELLIGIFVAVFVVLLFPYIWRFSINAGAVITSELTDSLKTAISEYKTAWKDFDEDFKRLFGIKRKKAINKPEPIIKNVQVEADSNGVKVFFELPESDPVAKKLMEDIKKGQSTSFELCTDNKENS